MHCSTDKRVLQTKKRLTDALLAELKKQPIYCIKVSDLCKAAGISRATFYNNFDSMDEIVFNLLTRFEEPIHQKAEEIRKEEDLSLSEATKRFIYSVVEILSAHYDVFAQILTGNSGIAVFDRRFNFYKQDFVSILDNFKDYIRDIPFERLCFHAASSLTGRIAYFARHPNKYTLEEQQSYVYSLTYGRYKAYFTSQKEEDHV